MKASLATDLACKTFLISCSQMRKNRSRTRCNPCLQDEFNQITWPIRETPTRRLSSQHKSYRTKIKLVMEPQNKLHLLRLTERRSCVWQPLAQQPRNKKEYQLLQPIDDRFINILTTRGDPGNDKDLQCFMIVTLKRRKGSNSCRIRPTFVLNLRCLNPISMSADSNQCSSTKVITYSRMAK